MLLLYNHSGFKEYIRGKYIIYLTPRSLADERNNVRRYNPVVLFRLFIANILYPSPFFFIFPVDRLKELSARKRGESTSVDGSRSTRERIPRYIRHWRSACQSTILMHGSASLLAKQTEAIQKSWIDSTEKPILYSRLLFSFSLSLLSFSSLYLALFDLIPCPSSIPVFFTSGV